MKMIEAIIKPFKLDDGFNHLHVDASLTGLARGRGPYRVPEIAA